MKRNDAGREKETETEREREREREREGVCGRRRNSSGG